MIKDPYKTLGVEHNASKDKIKTAYRKLAKNHHPDANGGDDGKFKEINEAYKILTDPKVRAKFEEDKMHAAHRNNPFGFGGNAGFWQNAGQQNMEDILRGFAYAQGDGVNVRFHTKIKRKIHGGTITIRAFFTLEEVFKGRAFEVKIDRQERINSEKRHVVARKIKVNIPKGAKSGQQLILRGQGNQGINGGNDGHVIIAIEIKPHKYFLRKGHDLYSRICILFTQAILGDVVKFTNINGEKVNIIIPKGTQADDIVKINYKGMPVGNSNARGHLNIMIDIELPKDLTDEQKQVFEVIQSQIGRKDEVSPVEL